MIPTLRRPGTRRSRGVAVCGAVLALALTGCASVAVDAPALTGEQARACADFVDSLPDELVDQRARDVDEPERAAAWGDPAIVLVCGAEVPVAYDDFSECIEADGVGWFVSEDEVRDASSEVTLSAVGHEPLVSVTLPADYRPAGPAAAMTQLADSVREHLTQTNPCD